MWLTTSRMQEYHQSKGLVAFSLVYLTFFLDNVLLTVLVPIIPDWVQGESLAMWTEHGAPLATLLNTTVQRITQEDAGSVGTSQAIVGAVLGAKAATQLVVSPAAAELTAARGPAIALRLATALLATAALVFGWCAGGAGGRGGGAVCAGVGRAAQGAGAALGGVAGLALAARALHPDRRDRGLGALLGAVALGVLVGYPFGGTAYKLWSPAAPFQLIAIALLFNLGLQHLLLDKDEYTITDEGGAVGLEGMRREAVRGAGGACAGAVLVTTSVMAALEPCLPLWIMHKFHPERWALGAVFLPDSAGYLLAASSLGGAARRAGPERVAIAAVLVVGVASLVVPHAPSVGWVSVPQAALGAGLGATDAALVPALLASRRRALPHRAALLQAASSAAYAIGPVVGGVGSWCAGFESALRALGVANLLYAAFLYRALSKHPLSEKWGASTSPDDSDDGAEEITPLGPTCNAQAFRPGPGAYKLPTTVGFPQHDPSRYRNPMYSFGTNAGFRLKQRGPGPAYRIDKVTREGLTSSPAWSFGARFPTRGTLRTPGPGAHAPERCPPTKEPRAPLYSMGQRLGFELKRPGPAPNAYALHLGSGTPAYTMGLRVGFNLKPKSPGPAVYFQQNADVYKNRPPCYTLGARSAGAGKATRTPGPATYPPNLYNTKKNPYAYSFGTKHGDYAPPMIIKEDTMDCL